MNATRGISFRPKFLAVLFTTVLALMLASPAQIQPSHASGPCTKVNAVKVVSGAKFVCKKVGSKLQWVKQGSNAVVNNQPSSPAPSTTVKEWTKCPTAGKVSGSGDKALSCVKVSGKLQWVKNTTLDTPVPKRPCRSEGQIGNWQGEVVLCTSYSSGKIWQIPVFDEDLGSLPGNQGTLTQFRLIAPGCHSNATKAFLETEVAGTWREVKPATYVASAECSGASSRVEATHDANAGSSVRIRVETTRWRWYTAPFSLSSNRDVFLSYSFTMATPSTTRVSVTPITNVSGSYGFEFVRYQWIGDESVFFFKLASNSRPIYLPSATNFNSSRGLTPIFGRLPRSGSWLYPNDEFEIRVKQSGIQWDLNRFEYDLSGQDNGVPYTFRIATDFTWR